MVSGLPWEIIKNVAPKVSSSLVFLYSTLMMRSVSAPFFKSMTMRMPSLEDWLEMSVISGKLRVLLPNTSAWQDFGPDAQFSVPGSSSFGQRAETMLPSSQ